MADAQGLAAALNPVLAGRQPSASYNTPLDPGQEQFFRQWVDHNKVPFNPDAQAPGDYDMRGFYQGLQRGDPRARQAIDPNDSRMHFPDTWKTPAHETFSNESQWAPGGAPQWTPNDQLSSGGRVLFDDKNTQRQLLAKALEDPQQIGAYVGAR